MPISYLMLAFSFESICSMIGKIECDDTSAKFARCKSVKHYQRHPNHASSEVDLTKRSLTGKLVCLGTYISLWNTMIGQREARDEANSSRATYGKFMLSYVSDNKLNSCVLIAIAYLGKLMKTPYM
jgi:hypothetical protein